jgi:hypothetical protein
MDNVVCRFRNPTQGHGTRRVRLAAMKPSEYAARLGRNGKKAEWSYRLDLSNSEERCTGGGNGFSTEGWNDQLVLALITCEGLSSLSDRDLHYGKGTYRRRRLRQDACIHYFSDRHNTSRYSFCFISPDSESRFHAWLLNSCLM